MTKIKQSNNNHFNRDVSGLHPKPTNNKFFDNVSKVTYVSDGTDKSGLLNSLDKYIENAKIIIKFN